METEDLSKTDNYTTITDPYNQDLTRGDLLSSGNAAIESSAVEVNSDASSIDDESQIGVGTVNSGSFKNLWIKNYIKSHNYIPKKRGFMIDGINGYIEAMDIYIVGNITGGTITIGTNAWHVDATGNMWWGNYATYAAALAADATRIASDGTAKFNGIIISGYIAEGGAAADVNSHATTIDGDSITTGSVTATQLSTTLLYAGAITLDTDGCIKSGQTDYDTGTGFWIGNDGGTPKLSIGNSAGNKMTWDGTSLSLTGSITATTGTIGGWIIGATTLTSGAAVPRIVLDKGNNKIQVLSSATEYVDLVTDANNSYFRAVTSGAIIANIGYTAGGTYNIMQTLEISGDIDSNPSSRNYPYASFITDSNTNHDYLQIDIYNSDVNISSIYINYEKSTGQSILGVDKIGGSFDGISESYEIIMDFSGLVGDAIYTNKPFCPSGAGIDLGSASNGWGVWLSEKAAPPGAAGSYRGYMYYDTAASDVVFSNGTNWYKITATLL